MYKDDAMQPWLSPGQKPQDSLESALKTHRQHSPPCFWGGGEGGGGEGGGFGGGEGGGGEGGGGEGGGGEGGAEGGGEGGEGGHGGGDGRWLHHSGCGGTPPSQAIPGSASGLPL